MFRSRSLFVLLAATTLACASSQSPRNSANRNLVTDQELAVAGDVNLYDALARVRPAFLQSRIGGGTSGVQAGNIAVILDGTRMHEGLEALRQIGARGIASVQFLEPQQANARYGQGTSAGALVITSKK